MGHKEHKHNAPKCVKCRVITVSDTRTEADDESGKLLVELLAGAGHEVTGKVIVTDDRAGIAAAINDAVRTGAEAIILNGGTGIAGRDSTLEAVLGFMEKELPGFGELFRRLSYDEIGSAAIMSRATAGVGGGVFIVSLPGSKNAVRLAAEKIVIPELAHAVYEINKK